MFGYVPTRKHIREALLLYYNQNKSVTDSHQLLVDTYGEQSLSLSTCEFWFKKFKNGEFKDEDKKRGGQRKIKDDREFQEFSDCDSSETQEPPATTLSASPETINKRPTDNEEAKTESKSKKRKCSSPQSKNDQ